MADVYGNRVFESSTSTGTGNITLLGAWDASYFRVYKAGARVAGDRCVVTIEHTSLKEIEICWATIVDENTLSRGTVLASTNGDVRVSLQAGLKKVYMTFAGEQAAAFAPVATAQAANRIFGGPASGADALPAFRAMVAADIPNGLIADIKISDVAASKLTGDMVIARMQAALAAGGYPAKVTTFEATSDLILTGAPGKIRPAVDSTTALQFANVAGTAFATLDTTNGRLGIGITPTQLFHVSGSSPSTDVARLVNTSATGEGVRLEVNHATNALAAFRMRNSGGDVWAVTGAGRNIVGASMYATPPTAQHQIHAASGVPGQIIRTNGADALRVQDSTGATTYALIDSVGLGRFTGLRIDQAPVAATPTPTHTIVINFNGTDYRVPCVI